MESESEQEELCSMPPCVISKKKPVCYDPSAGKVNDMKDTHEIWADEKGTQGQGKGTGSQF